ncbi:MAG: GntR family transcriptional regulator [Acidimicrobiales bacterium]
MVALRDLDPASDRPKYRRIADALREAIDAGELGPGDKLPSEAELMARYKTAGGTVRHAIDVLRGEGIVVAEHGRGVFVRSRPRTRRLSYDRFARRHRQAGKAAYLAEAEQTKVTPRVEVLFVGREPAPPEPASQLGLDRGADVLVRRRRYLSDDQPTELATSYVPWHLAEGTAMVDENPGPGGIYARIEELGHRLAHFTEEVTARMPTPEEASALGLPPATPVLHLVRTAFDGQGMAVEVCDTVMSADEWVLSYRLPAD